MQVGGEPTFKIGCHTLRHSFAIHLLLYGRPLKFVSQLLGHRSAESTENYTNVLTLMGRIFSKASTSNKLHSETINIAKF